jgi:hypothetical protein
MGKFLHCVRAGLEGYAHVARTSSMAGQIVAIYSH